MFFCWIKRSLGALLSLLVLLGVLNFIFDPYMHYRFPFLYPAYFGSNQRYLNPGMAKHLSYDSAIIGTSMTEQIDMTKLRDWLGWHAIKLSISGATAHEQTRILSQALPNPSLKHVLWGVDFYSFGGEVESYRNGQSNFPYYLYDSNPFNDTHYLLSLDTFKTSLQIFKKLYLTKELFYFQRENFSLPKEKPHNRHLARHYFANKIAKNPKGYFDIEKLKRSLDENLLKPIRANPQIHFHLVLPPYSILAWNRIHEQGWISDALEFRQYLAAQAESLPHVSLYDPQSNLALITQLNNYADPTHYLPSYHDIILRMLQKGETSDASAIQYHNGHLLRFVENLNPHALISSYGDLFE